MLLGCIGDSGFCTIKNHSYLATQSQYYNGELLLIKPITQIIMRALHCLFCLLLILPGILVAQTRQTFRVSGSEIDVEQHAEPAFLYLHEDFVPALIVFPDGREQEAELRYHIMLDEMQFLSRRGEVQNLSRRPPFQRIEMESGNFVYHHEEGYLEVLHDGQVPLYHKRAVRVNAQPIKRGAYGSADPTAAIESVDRFQVDGRVATLENPGGGEMEVTLRYVAYFFLDIEGEMTQINNQRQFLRAFREHRSELRTFIGEQDTDFDAPADMVRLVQYLESLVQ